MTTTVLKTTPEEIIEKLEKIGKELENLPTIDGGVITKWWSLKMDQLSNETYGQLQQLLTEVVLEASTKENERQFNEAMEAGEMHDMEFEG